MIQQIKNLILVVCVALFVSVIKYRSAEACHFIVSSSQKSILHLPKGVVNVTKFLSNIFVLVDFQGLNEVIACLFVVFGVIVVLGDLKEYLCVFLVLDLFITQLAHVGF